MQANLVPLVKSVQRQLEGWSKVKLSWFGRMAAIKMKILPQFLFLFHSVILKLSKSEIQEVQIGLSPGRGKNHDIGLHIIAAGKTGRWISFP